MENVTSNVSILCSHKKKSPPPEHFLPPHSYTNVYQAQSGGFSCIIPQQEQPPRAALCGGASRRLRSRCKGLLRRCLGGGGIAVMPGGPAGLRRAE